MWWSASHTLWAITWRSFNVLLHFSFKYWMYGMKESFLSKIMPRNLYWTTARMSDSSRFNVGLLCIFLSWQKCTHWILVMGIFKAVYYYPFVYFVDAQLQLTFSYTYIFGCRGDVEVINKYLSTLGFRLLVILFIFMLKRVTDSKLPRRTPSSWFWMFDRVEPIWTQNFLSERKAFIKFGSLPFIPLLCRSFMIPNLQVVSYTFSRSKNITTRCCFCMIASCIEVS